MSVSAVTFILATLYSAFRDIQALNRDMERLTEGSCH